MLTKLATISLLILLTTPACSAKENTDKPDKPDKKEDVSLKDEKEWDDKCTHEKEKHGCDQCPERVFSCEYPKPKPPIPGAPGPLPIVGIFAAYNQSRKIRNRIKNK
jgi:hypothetical protein